MKKTTLFLGFTLLGVAAVTFDQTPVRNPKTATWDYTQFSPGQQYELGYFLFPIQKNKSSGVPIPTLNGDCDFSGIPGTTPVQVESLGKSLTTTGLDITAQMIARPVGCYRARIRALSESGLYSPWSELSNSFQYRLTGRKSPGIK